MSERLVGHYWPKIRTSDANIDDVAYGFARMAFPRALPDTVGKVSHFVEYSMYLRRHIFSIYENRHPSRGSQCRMQNCTVFRDVYLFPAIHTVDALSQAGFLGQLNKES